MKETLRATAFVLGGMKFTILFLALTIFASYFLITSHEQVHVAINRYWDMESNISIGLEGFNLKGITTITSNIRNCNDSCRLAHSINEAIGYQMIPLITIIVIGLFCIISFLEYKKLDEEIKQLEIYYGAYTRTSD